LAVTSTPSVSKVVTAMCSKRPRRPVSAHHHTYPMASSISTAMAAWKILKASAARDSPEVWACCRL
jgi:hypothetical protein